MKERLNIQRRNVDLVNLTFFKQIIDSLIWLTSIRPDIVYDVSLLNNLGITKQSHLQATNMILRHLKGTLPDGLFDTHGEEVKLIYWSFSLI